MSVKTSNVDVIACCGRVGDRTDFTSRGALLTAEALATRALQSPLILGNNHPPKDDDWRSSLADARDTLVALRQTVEDRLLRNRVPLLAASTCCASLATLPLVAHHHPDAVILWMDAHGDFNTPEISETGYLGGMVLAAACGLWDSGHGGGLNPQNVVVAGARDIDLAEDKLLQQSGVRVLSKAEATPALVSEAVGNRPLWVHVDWDVLEPSYVPAEYGVPDGLAPKQLSDIFSALKYNTLYGLEMAEFSPCADDLANQASLDVALQCLEPFLSKLIY